MGLSVGTVVQVELLETTSEGRALTCGIDWCLAHNLSKSTALACAFIKEAKDPIIVSLLSDTSKI